MPPVLHHALLGVSVAALGAAGLRAASPLAPVGLPRALVAATFASAVAVAESLALGLFALGGSTAALVLAALATWVAARLLLPEPGLRAADELAIWWHGRSTPERAVLGALAGAAAAWAAWQLRYPALGFDTVLYHLPEIVLWLQHGTPGSIQELIPDQPVGSYPLTAEVTIAWGMGISRSFVPLVLFPWAWIALTATAGWVGLRALGVRPLVVALAVAALCTNPWLLAWQATGGITDPPAVAWLVACAALCALSRERPVLLAPALVAAALSAGSKTTALPMLVAVLAIGLWLARRKLRTVAWPLAISAAAAVAVGGVWYVRDLVTHGSPFWPIVSAPWGDPVPHSIALVDTSFFERLGPTLDRLGDEYVQRFAGGIVLLAGGVLAVLAAPRARRVRWASLAVLVGFLLWATAPVTGVPVATRFDGVIFSTLRYLLPVIAAAAFALAVAGAGRSRAAWAPLAVLVAATVLNVAQVIDLGFPLAPSAATPLIGAVAGALLATALGFATRSRVFRLPRVAVLAAVVAGGCALAIPASGFLSRHAETRPVFTETVTRWLAADPQYRSQSKAGVATSPAYIGPLAGDRLEHRLSSLASDATCSAIAARARGSWLVVAGGAVRGAAPARVSHCLGGARPAFSGGGYSAYRPSASP
ncbi:MAG TPA: hypothetical protein VGC98_00045 [Thermoleophilaceae bacterium]